VLRLVSIAFGIAFGIDFGIFWQVLVAFDHSNLNMLGQTLEHVCGEGIAGRHDWRRRESNNPLFSVLYPHAET